MSDVWKVIWNDLPPGFRFRPTDEEFVNHYLTNYIRGTRDYVDVIPVVDDLFKRDPSELPDLFRGSSIIRSRDPEWWFLSTLKYKSRNSDKFDRSTSKGSWNITGGPKEIHERGVNRKIAEMRILVFRENPTNKKTNWVIHEYYLTDSSFALNLREQRKYVLCHLVNREYDYTETLANMDVDLEFEAQQHGFSEEIIQAKIRSLTEGPPSPAATNASLHNPPGRRLLSTPVDDFDMMEYGMSLTEVGPVDHFDEREHAMSTSGGDEDVILAYLNHMLVSSDEEKITHIDDFEYASGQWFELEETSQVASNHVVLKENRQAKPPGALEGYVVIDETRRFVEDDFQRVEAGDASSLPDSPKTPPTKYPEDSPHKHSVFYLRRMEAQSADFWGSDHRSTPVIERRQSTPPGRYHNIKEGKAKGAGIAGTEPHFLTPEVRRNWRTGPQTLQPRAGNEKMPVTSREKNRAGDGSRPPFDYLVNLAVSIILIVLMMSWLLMY